MQTEIEALLEPLAEIEDLGRARALLAWDERTDAAARRADACRADRHADGPGAPQDRLRRARATARRSRGEPQRRAVRLVRGQPRPRRPARLGEGAQGAERAASRDRPRDLRRRARLGERPARSPTSRRSAPTSSAWSSSSAATSSASSSSTPTTRCWTTSSRECEPPSCARCSSASATASCRCSRRSSPAVSSSTRRRSTGTSPPRRSGGWPRRSRRRCPWSRRRGAWTRPCTRSRSGSRSPTCGSPPASTPSTWEPRCGRSCTRPATCSTRTGSARSWSARRCAGRSRSASTSLRAGSGRTGWAGVGRSCPACCRCLPTRFGEPFESLGVERLYQAANVVAPSLIRVEADEVTYNLHVILRFELEQQIFDGKLAIADLPEAWNARMHEYFGIEVPDDAVRGAPGRPLVGGRLRLLPDLLAWQRDRGPGVGARTRGARRPRRAARRRRPAPAPRVPGRAHLPPRRQARAGRR